MDFRMETFLKVCEVGNFTKAAKALNITQPAVSGHIHYQEALYEVKLFSFEGKKMSLTEEGKELYQVGIRMKHDEENLRRRLKNKEEHKRKMCFGATLTIGEFVMAPRLTKLLKENPQMQIRMLIGNTKELLDKLRVGEIDFAIVEGNYEKGNYDSLLFAKEEYVAVCAPNYKFQSTPQRLTDLLEERLIVREIGSGTREILEKNLEARNLGVDDFQYYTEIGGMNGIISLVEAGMGITFLYRVAVGKELENGTLNEVKLMDFQVSHDFAFIWNKGSIFGEDYRKIYDKLQEN